MKKFERALARMTMVVLLALSPFVSVQGQPWRYYSTENGLSNSLVNAICQDNRGFVWIATEYGLNRFDGVKFTVYNHIQGDSTSLSDNYVRTIYQTGSGRLLIGTINGLSDYDPGRDCFRGIALIEGGKKVAAHVTAMAEMPSGELWITSSGKGLFVLAPGARSAVCRTDITARLSSVFLNSILRTPDGDIWMGSETSGLNRYSPKDDKVEIFRAPSRLPGDDISAIACDHGGQLFVATLTRGLSRYDAQSGHFNPVPWSGSARLLIYLLLATPDGRLLVGTDGQGLKVLDAAKGVLEDYDMGRGVFDFDKVKVHAILRDADDNLWLGLFQKGVVYIPRTESKFDYYGYRSRTPGRNVIGSSSVMSIFRDSAGVLWVGTDNDGLYGIDPDGKVVHFRGGSGSSSVPDIIQSIFEDSDRNIWISSYTRGLARLDPRTGSCRYIPAFASEKVYCVTQDNDRNLLVGTYGSGFYMLDLRSGAMRHYESSKLETDNLSSDELANDWINCLLTDREGKIWIGHYKGLSCFDPVRGTFINYLGQNNVLPGTVVNAVYEGRGGEIWAGTASGLYRFDRQTSKIERFTTAEGLPSDMICGITQDERMNLWVSTYKGISKFSYDRGEFLNYYAGDGLQGNEFTRGAVFRDSSGKIYFGGTGGVTAFDPRDIEGVHRTLKLLLVGFYRHDEIVRSGDRSGNRAIVSGILSEAEDFNLSWRDNTFTFELSAMEFANPGRISYQYRMTGLGHSNAWSTTYQGVNRVTYNNLPPGRYVFTVRATDGSNFSPERTFTVTVRPPWYATWWVYCIYAVICLLIVGGVVNYVISRLRYRRQMLEKEHAQQLGEAKLQFFINISHEIRTPMTLIISPLEKLLAELKDESVHRILLMIYRNAQRILRLINQLMDVRKLDKGQMRLRCRETDMVGFIEDLMLTFDYTARKRAIDFRFVHPDEKLKVWIDLNNFDKVLLNIFSNAFKFTPEGGSIEVTLTTGRSDGRLRSDYFEISVRDSGSGIDEQQRERIFDRFYQVDNSQNNANFGTGVGLHLSRQLVELHSGEISVRSRADGATGAEFVIRLPMGNAHLLPQQMENPDEMAQSSAPYRAMLSGERLFEEPAVAVHAEKSGKSKSNRRILVVDDEEEIRSYIRSELSPLYRVEEACDGKDALEKLLTGTYNIVVSDVMMPRMDGFALLRKMRQNININHIPVILLTARAQDDDRIEGLDTGADAYIAKPFSITLLVHTIDNLISGREQLRVKFSGSQEHQDKMTPIEIKSADEMLMKRILKFIDDNIANPDLKVEMMAVNVGLSRVHMHRKLKELTGQSARDFIRGIRLRQAAVLLADRRLTVSDVAYATGFINLSHFSSSFREFYGMSPKEYAARATENLEPEDEHFPE